MFRLLFVRRHRIYVHADHASSLGGRINALAGVRLSQRSWLLVEELSAGIFKVVDDNLRDKDAGALGFQSWDSEVQNLEDPDRESDGYQCFGIASKLQWKDVHMTPYEFHAPSVGRLTEALSHVSMCAWCMDDL